MTIPETPIIESRPNPDYRGAWIAVVQCPGCGRRHTHGIAAKEATRPIRQHRVSQCTSDGPRATEGYYITGPALGSQ